MHATLPLHFAIRIFCSPALEFSASSLKEFSGVASEKSEVGVPLSGNWNERIVPVDFFFVHL